MLSAFPLCMNGAYRWKIIFAIASISIASISLERTYSWKEMYYE